ncbi:MAG TPA: hypothetical protein VFE03_12510 [Caulobacteraceae bacterium]|nr:hypothetical protein [Caulobacteraceae bacterium]
MLAVGEGEHPEVMVAPITSREPGRRDAIQLGAGAVGVDRGSWIIHWELNVFVWPGPDVGAAAAPAGAWWRIGALAPSLRVRLADLIRDGLRARAVSITRRTE